MTTGSVLANRYRLEAELGRGGMGVVYRAWDTLLDRPVAVKVLSHSGLGVDARARLLREARAAARLNHPHIVSIHDAGEAGDAAFIVMELVEGESLFDRRPGSFGEVIAIARDVCAALEHAHAHGIVHRDLKPENVLIGRDGSAKLMDFGLARLAASRQSSEGALVGTVFYLAPEQALGQDVDGRADLYALGVMLYELVTGRLPFTGDDPLVVLSQHVHAPVAPPHTHRADVPPALEAIILRLLAKNPADRFASARDLAAALADVADGRAPRLPPTPRHNLPIQLTSFVGREREIDEVRRLLATSRLVTLTGAGGCGKSRLALQMAGELVVDYRDGVWLIELAPVSDPALVPQTVMSVLDVREEPGHLPIKTLADALRSRSLLLILDNCEHLIEACAQLAELLLRTCPGINILGTSREALGIAGESSFRVPSLASPDPRRLAAGDDVTQYEAARLFVDRALTVRPEFAVTPANAPAIAQICQQLDGMPLAIELAAARVRAMTAEQIAARLDDRFHLLTGGSRTALPRHQALRALIDWSWDLLSDAERTLLRRLSMFWGGWTLEMAEAVCGGAGLDVLDLLMHLVDKSLVVMEEHGREPRYRLLETIRQYAREKQIEAGETDVARSRHLDYFVNLSETAEPGLRRADQVVWLARLETEHDNLRAALKWSLHSQNTEAGLRLSGSLWRFWYVRGYWREGRDWLRRALSETVGEAETESGRRMRATALAGLGWLADEDGSETAPYTEALALYRALGDRWGAAFCLRGLGAGESNRGNQEQALRLLDESLALFRETEDAWGIALALFNLGWAAFYRDDARRAETAWQNSLQLFQESGDRWGIAITFGALGYAARLRGDYHRAAHLSEESLALFRELGDRAGISTSLNRLGNVAFRRGDYREATALLEESQALERDRGDRSGLITTLSLLGLVRCYQADYRRAMETLDEALAIADEIDDGYSRAYILGYQGLAAHYQGDPERAALLWRDSLALQREREDSIGIASALIGLGLAAHASGDQNLARQQLEESLALCRTAGDKRCVAIALYGLARVAQAQGDAARAARLFGESLSLRKEMGDKQGIAESLEGLAEVEASLAGNGGNMQRAARLFGAAEALRQAIGAPVPPVERPAHEQAVAAARGGLDQDVFASAWSEGKAMTMEQSVAYALKKATGA